MNFIFYRNILTFLLRFVSFLFVVVMAGTFVPAVAFSADESPGFEIQDLRGSTENYSSTVGVTPINVPTTASKVISEIFFKCSSQTPATIRCHLSFNGTTYLTMLPGESLGWSVKGNKKQVKIYGSGAGVLWEAVINYENY